MSTDTTIAQTIGQQMGGLGRISAMTGAKKFVAHPDGLAFRFPNQKSSKGNHVKVTLRTDDLYDMEFTQIRGGRFKQVKLFEAVYNDQLKGIFENQTGLYLSLGRMV